MTKYLLLLLLACTLALPGRAESLRPAPSPAAVDSLKTLLWRSPPGSARRLQLLLSLSKALLDRREDLGTPLDSAAVYTQQAAALSIALGARAERIGCLLALGRLSRVDDDTAGARSQLREAIRLSQQLGSQVLEAEGWAYLSDTYPPVAGNLPRIIDCMQQARRLYQRAGRRREEAFMLESLAGQHILQGESAAAIAELKQAVRLFRAAGYRRLHYCYDLLLYAHKQQGDYGAALQYGMAAIESAVRSRDTADVAMFYSRVGDIYREQNQLDNALRYKRRALASAALAGHEGLVLPLSGHISDILLLQQRPQAALEVLQRVAHNPAYRRLLEHNGQFMYYLARAYTAQPDYARAEKCYQAMLRDLAPDVKEVDRLLVYYSVGKFYWLTRQYPQARDYLGRSLALSARVGTLPQTAGVHLLLFKIDSAQGRFPAAIAHYQQYKQLNDSVFSATKSKQLARLQVQYDTRKKEQDIALLTRQAQVQQARLRQRELQRNAMLGGAGLLLLLLGVSYNRARIKRRSTRLLEEKQQEINQKNHSLEQVLGEKEELLAEKEGLLVEKEWMLKEIHHRVKNNLQIVSELLDSQIDQLQEPRTLAIIRESQNRVQAMALVHQKLYQSRNLARVDMQEYVREIVEHLFTSFHCQRAVQAELDVAAIELDVAVATPLGLIINEAVTNSLKYAFPAGRPGTIRIGLTPLTARRYQLTLTDDGIGLPTGFDLDATRTMGLTLIRGLSEQLEAELTFSQAPGLCISLAFEAPVFKPSAA